MLYVYISRPPQLRLVYASLECYLHPEAESRFAAFACGRLFGCVCSFTPKGDTAVCFFLTCIQVLEARVLEARN